MSKLTNLDAMQSNDVTTERRVIRGVEHAFRILGRGDGPPLVLLQRFRGTMDDWDPAFLDALARERTVIVFDNVGVGLTEGVASSTIGGMAASAIGVIEEVAGAEVDLFGWSMGGAVVQRIALDRPALVRRLVLAGTGPGGGPQARPMLERVLETMQKDVNDDDDFLYLFFHDTPSSVAAGRAHLGRLRRRREPAAPPVKRESVLAQLAAISAWARGTDSAFDHLSAIRQPVLVATGMHDVMVDPLQSYVLARALPRADLVIHADAGHGFLFQEPWRMAHQTLEFLRRP